jgi:putative tricarboxylic transport membrane protein
MIDVFVTALQSLFTVQHLLYMALGVLLGLAVGIFPGLGGIAGLSMLIPFLYGLDTVSALAMLIGLVAVIPTSDTFTSVLMGIPGSSASQATILDGFPLAKKGEAARALAAAFSASLIGGIIGAVLLTFFVLIARPLILAFGSAELFMLAVLGLSMVGVLSGSSLAKGLSACGLGLLVGSIGTAPATGETRMIFGVDYLWDGLPLVIVGLGIFAFPEIVDLLRQERAIAKSARLGAGWLTGLKDTFRHWFICLRCSGLGAVIGAIPGLGGSVVDWIAYGHVVQTSRDKSRFGSGDIRGVLAPESANNAKEGGGLMPTLLFGIPGSGSMAIFLGGMVLIGIQPGPMMVSVDLDLTYTIIWSLALANVLGAGLCLVLAQPIAHLTTIRFALLAPFMIMVISFAAFQATRALNDLLFLFAVGVLGVFLKRFGWPRPAFLIGFVLAGQAETYLYQAVQFYGWNFLTRPGVVIIALITLASVWLGSRSRVGEAGVVATPAAGQAAPPPKRPSAPKRGLQSGDLRERLPQIAFAAIVFAYFVYAFQHAYQKSFLGGIFPLIVSGAMLVFGAYLLWQLVSDRPGGPADFDQEQREPFADRPTRDLWLNVAWFAGLFVGAALVGFIIALAAFFVVFLRVRAGVSWLRVAVLTAGGLSVILVLGHFLVLDFPRGLLQDMVDLPWPLR